MQHISKNKGKSFHEKSFELGFNINTYKEKRKFLEKFVTLH